MYKLGLIIIVVYSILPLADHFRVYVKILHAKCLEWTTIRDKCEHAFEYSTLKTDIQNTILQIINSHSHKVLHCINENGARILVSQICFIQYCNTIPNNY